MTTKLTPLTPLADWLRHSAQDLAGAEPDAARADATLAAMQAALRQRQRAAKPGRRLAWNWRWSWGRPLAWSGAATCASLMLGAVLLLSLEPGHLPAELEAGASGFVPLVSSERWAAYLQENGGSGRTANAWVVDSELPRERLALLGLPYNPAQAGERVRAELLLHASGDVLAVRLLR
jgi:hypothetical protein